MLTLVKLCACSAAAVALSSPTSIEPPASASEVADVQTSAAVLDFSAPIERSTQPTCRQCNFWAALSAAR
jgi:hypothetical protein